ncbi:hypothetical protein [Chitinilyticum litopenaei]|uniref:hypothetical protein n=1 Tax=Chitinilyticum litopenaei TaxID=1121276 RepID=UPI00042430B7|nr:hypothetical protein [Chitinilyticum litopenaei]
MDFLTQEQQDEITRLQADYQTALAEFLAKHEVVQALDEKLAAIDKTISAAESEAEAARSERKSLIATLLGSDTKPLKAAKAKERSAYAVVEDYQELRADLVKERELLAFNAMDARNKAAHLRNKARENIGIILRNYAIQQLCQSQAMALLMTALRIQPIDYTFAPHQATFSASASHANTAWFERGISGADIKGALTEIEKKSLQLSAYIPAGLENISEPVPCANNYEWLSPIGYVKRKESLGLQ